MPVDLLRSKSTRLCIEAEGYTKNGLNCAIDTLILIFDFIASAHNRLKL